MKDKPNTNNKTRVCLILLANNPKDAYSKCNDGEKKKKKTRENGFHWDPKPINEELHLNM